ncbi:MAG TPA: hypothetical protein VGD16_08270 [Enterovirga sp.]
MNVDRGTAGSARTANPSSIPSSGSAGVNVDRGGATTGANAAGVGAAGSAGATSSATDAATTNQRLNDRDRAINSNLLQGGICEGCNKD